MAKKCDGLWNLTLKYDDGDVEDDGFVVIEKEDANGNFKGKHTSSNDNEERDLRKGKCKDGKISFERDHEDEGVIVYFDGVVGEDRLDGKFKIVEGDSLDESEGDRSKYGGKDKDKKRAVGDTGIWTGTKDGLDKDKKPKKGEGGGQSAR